MTEELDQLRATMRAFCDREVRPGARDRDRDESFPTDLVAKMVDIGILGAAIPTEFGGMGLDAHGYQAVIEELGAADSSLRSMASVNLGLVGMSIMAWGTREQQERWLPGLAAGRLGAFGLTEPDAGSNPSQMTSRAVRDGDDWVINGAKVYITNGSLGAVTMIFARAIDGGDDLGITCYLVPQDAPGYDGRQIHGKLGLRSGDTAEIALTDVRVPGDSVLGEVGGGMKVALSALDNGRFSLSAGCVGTCREALEVAVRYATERTQFGKPIASFQLVQELLAAIHVDHQAAAPWSTRSPPRRRPASGSPWRCPPPSCSPPRQPSAAPTAPSRSTAVTATSTSTPSSACSAMPGSPRCTRAPARSSTCIIGDQSEDDHGCGDQVWPPDMPRGRFGLDVFDGGWGFGPRAGDDQFVGDGVANKQKVDGIVGDPVAAEHRPDLGLRICVHGADQHGGRIMADAPHRDAVDGRQLVENAGEQRPVSCDQVTEHALQDVAQFVHDRIAGVGHAQLQRALAIDERGCELGHTFRDTNLPAIRFSWRGGGVRRHRQEQHGEHDSADDPMTQRCGHLPLQQRGAQPRYPDPLRLCGLRRA
jgi:alkylation response protein AidB-like acyl-CoA dehydrogenase